MYKYLWFVKYINGDIMCHEVDMNKYKIRTDLAVDNIKISKKDIKKRKDINVIDIYVDDKMASLIGRKKGYYLTIEFNDITDTNNYNELKNVLEEELNHFLNKLNIKKNDKCLIIGLGNSNLLPDSLGPKVTDKIIVTEPIFKLDNLDNKYRRVSIFNPSVYGITGIDTVDIIKSIVEANKPNFIIVVDSLVSKSIERINKTIQITDSGISPGSGIGYSKEISKKILGIPVISIGVPTVLSTTSLIDEIIKEIPPNNITDNLIDVINQKIDLYNLIIMSNDLDYFMKKCSLLIAMSINEILHK